MKRIRIHIKIKRIRNTDLNKTISCEEKGQGTEFFEEENQDLKKLGLGKNIKLQLNTPPPQLHSASIPC